MFVCPKKLIIKVSEHFTFHQPEQKYWMCVAGVGKGVAKNSGCGVGGGGGCAKILVVGG